MSPDITSVWPVDRPSRCDGYCVDSNRILTGLSQYPVFKVQAAAKSSFVVLASRCSPLGLRRRQGDTLRTLPHSVNTLFGLISPASRKPPDIAAKSHRLIERCALGNFNGSARRSIVKTPKRTRKHFELVQRGHSSSYCSSAWRSGVYPPAVCAHPHARTRTNICPASTTLHQA